MADTALHVGKMIALLRTISDDHNARKAFRRACAEIISTDILVQYSDLTATLLETHGRLKLWMYGGPNKDLAIVLYHIKHQQSIHETGDVSEGPWWLKSGIGADGCTAPYGGHAVTEEELLAA